MTTIRDILAIENPELIHRWKGASYANTTSTTGSYDSVHFNDVQNYTVKEWEDFTYDAIELAYGDVLGAFVQGFKKPHTPRSSPRTIEEEDNLDSFWEIWTLDLLAGALKTAGPILRQRTQVSKQNAGQTDIQLGKKKLTWKKPNSKVEYKPDWTALDKMVGKIYPEEKSTTLKKLAYIRGDSKLTENWKSEYLRMTEKEAGNVPAPPSWKEIPLPDVPNRGQPKPLLVRGTHDVGEERILPLEQLSTYCRFAATRYFFITTQEEVVVFRVRRLDVNSLTDVDPLKTEKLHSAFEYKSTYRVEGVFLT